MRGESEEHTHHQDVYPEYPPPTSRLHNRQADVRAKSRRNYIRDHDQRCADILVLVRYQFPRKQRIRSWYARCNAHYDFRSYQRFNRLRGCRDNSSNDTQYA
jgi:hypothetical protein